MAQAERTTSCCRTWQVMLTFTECQVGGQVMFDGSHSHDGDFSGAHSHGGEASGEGEA
jgi:hypothetical protein